MTDMDKVLDKIRKLLALSSSPNEAEAASALTKAHEMLKKHNLSMVDLKDKTEDGIISFDFGDTGHNWRMLVINAIAQVNYCRVVRKIISGQANLKRRSYETHILVFGKEHNVEAVKVMADYILGAIEKGAKGHYGEGKSIVASYKVGFSDAICNRLYTMHKEEQADPECKALVVTADNELNQFMKKMNLVKIKCSHRISSPNGYLAGQVDGRNLSLHNQIKG